MELDAEYPGSDPQVASNPDYLEAAGVSPQTQEPEDVTMGNTEDEKQQMEAFGLKLSSKLDAVKDGGLEVKKEKEEKLGESAEEKGKDGEHRTKKKRTQAEEGAGSGRYENQYS